MFLNFEVFKLIIYLIFNSLQKRIGFLIRGAKVGKSF